MRPRFRRPPAATFSPAVECFQLPEPIKHRGEWLGRWALYIVNVWRCSAGPQRPWHRGPALLPDDPPIPRCGAAVLAQPAPLSLLQPLFFLTCFNPRRPWLCLKKQSTRCRGSLHRRASTTWWVRALKGHLSCMRRPKWRQNVCKIAAVVVGQLCRDAH